MDNDDYFSDILKTVQRFDKTKPEKGTNNKNE